MASQIQKMLPKAVKDKIALITGASSGIGLTVAKQLAAAGAHVLLVARTREKLEEVKAEIEAEGGKASVFPCDLNDMTSIDHCAKQILAEVGHIDILVNNAGRSIRRAVEESVDRFHDFERTMQLNYFGAVRLILSVLPHMVKRKNGHIINISSIGVLANATRFSAYVASKAALDAFSRCLSAEVRAHNIHLTSIYMPLVRTPMIAPTKIYKYVPTLSPEQASDMIAKAIIQRPKSIATKVGTFAAVSYALVPKFNDFVMSVGYQLFPSSTAAAGKGNEKKQGKLNLAQRAFARLVPGEHW
ncbi:SDR family NAD(P)-dependent oxidoreductase [Alkanindiges sp. WGS2144]|uniref:SDR family NAD(P)-dependent oxidoreductase n=1 Tax=Alkanindiges sp. WGS2144 TaxID=3366808 RepID=UPI003752E588